MGTNADEFALFLIALPLIVPHTSLPLTAAGVAASARYFSKYHRGWNESTAEAALLAYPVTEYNTQSMRLVQVHIFVKNLKNCRVQQLKLVARVVSSSVCNFVLAFAIS